MKKKLFKITEELEEKIISAAYGDADILSKIEVYLLRKKHSEVDELFLMYRTTARKIHQLHPEECPDHLVSEALKKSKRQESEKQLKSFFDLIFLKPTVPILTSAAVVLFLLISFIPTNKSPQYSEEEIILADQQVKKTLQIIGSVFNKTSKKVKDNILSEKVADPIYEGIIIIDDLFKENKNEKIN